MSPSSQLGPVDPQIILEENRQKIQFSAHDLVKSYDELFDGAVNCQGHIEPYVQQLAKYDARKIQAYKGFIELSQKMAVETLKTGMMKRATNETIRRKIQRFLDPELALSHGRPMFMDDALACGLKVEKVDTHSEKWSTVYELFLRTNHFVSTRAGKCIETARTSFLAPASAESEKRR